MKKKLRFLAVILFMFSFHCCKEEPVLPVLSTNEVTEFTTSSALSGGAISDDGGAPIISKGVCWSTSENPTIEDNKTVENVEAASFNSSLSQLLPKTKYYVRAYATNIAGIGYGNILSFTTLGDKPGINALNATNIQLNSSTINGSVNPYFLTTVVTFEWGTTINYGNSIVASQSPVTGNNPVNISADLSGLTHGTIYHFRLKAENSLGETYSSDLTFKTMGDVPTAESLSATNLQYNTVSINGQVNPNYLSTTVNFEWGETTLYGNIVPVSQSPLNGQTFINISADLTGLTQGLTYHFRILAENELGMTFSNDMTFTTLAPISDFEGNLYNIRTIGTQIWMTENLKATKYSDGTPISYGLYYPENNISKVDKYGYLYDWAAAIKQVPKYDTIMLDLQGQRVQGACPTNWHLPTEAEWLELINLFGGQEVAGLKLKIANPGYWLEPLDIQEPLSGFNAIPAGMRHTDGWYMVAGNEATYWTTTQWFMGGSIMGRNVSMIYCNPDVTILYTNGTNEPGSFGLSIRCIKD